jgi:hypothetical protein
MQYAIVSQYFLTKLSLDVELQYFEHVVHTKNFFRLKHVGQTPFYILEKSSSEKLLSKTNNFHHLFSSPVLAL